MNPSKPTSSAHVDDMIGSEMNQVTNSLSQVSLQSNAPASQASPTSEVLNVQKTSKKGGQKEKKRKEKNTNAIGNSGNNDKEEDEGDNKKK
jgi:hypothetical protein